MPIITITVPREVPVKSVDLAAVFAAAASIDPELVTVVVRDARHIEGNRYAAMVEILIPDLWNQQARKRFLKAAEQMLEKMAGIPAADAFVFLKTVRSGAVSDRGVIQKWNGGD